MDFTLSLQEAFGIFSPAAQKQQLLATNREAWESYGLRLSEADAEMLLQTAEHSLRAQELVQFGAGITPLIIHWFLPSGYLGRDYAGQIAALTEAFYRLKGDLQALYDEADDPECVLSDHAILDYMYRFYVSPTCGGDPAEMLAEAEQILVSGMRRLLESRAAKRQSQRTELGDPELRMLYADKLAQEESLSDWESEYEAEQYDYAYREEMHPDWFGNYREDYEDEIAVRTRGTYAEELEEALRRDPAFLLPSAAQEAEWAQQAEDWESADAAFAGKE